MASSNAFSAPPVLPHLAAIRMLFDWLVTGHVIDTNPAHSVRGPRYTVVKFAQRYVKLRRGFRNALGLKEIMQSGSPQNLGLFRGSILGA